jgi:hypothetical protein
MMKSSIYDRILQRELGHHSSTSNLKGVYSASEWIDDLDIVNELGGHTGCVNALRYVHTTAVYNCLRSYLSLFVFT